MKTITFTFALFLSTQTAFAFKGKKCWENIIVGPPGAVYKALGGKNHRDGWLVKAFGITTGSGSSTSSYITSTGSCSGSAALQREKTLYIAMNQRQIQMDSAKGSGESLEALAFYYGQEECSLEFSKTLKENYSKIFKENTKAEALDHSIQETLKNQPACLVKA